MAQATDVTTAVERPGGGTAKGRGARVAGPARYEITDTDEPVQPEPPVIDERSEAGHPEPPVEDEPDEAETPEGQEDDDEPDTDETPVSRQALVATGNARSRVQALLAEALRLGEAHHLIERRSDGSFALPGQIGKRRATSDCTCQTCSPHDQRHWWCVVCGAGPHDWLMVKPQYERQTLKPGGIEGARQAACSAQCARDFLAGLGRQPSGVPTSREIDPTLALPS